jgi:hypothetical protein
MGIFSSYFFSYLSLAIYNKGETAVNPNVRGSIPFGSLNFRQLLITPAQGKTSEPIFNQSFAVHL